MNYFFTVVSAGFAVVSVGAVVVSTGRVVVSGTVAGAAVESTGLVSSPPLSLQAVKNPATARIASNFFI